MPFGPTSGESMFLFQMPLMLAGVLALVMLFSPKTFVALIASCLIGLAWGALSTLMLQSLIGVLMLAFTPWVFVFILCATLFAVLRSGDTPESSNTVREESAIEKAPEGYSERCEVCNSAIPPGAEACVVCKLRAGRFTGWTI